MNNYKEKYWARRAVQYNKISWVKNKDFINAFLGMLPEQIFNSILEVGVGTGAVAEKFVEIIGPLIGIDISKEMISNINHPNITAMVGDVHKLKFDDNTFDLIYMRNVIHYVDNPSLALSEIYRCLKPGGHFLFAQVIPPDDSISEEYDWLIGRNIHYPTKSEIINLLKDFHIEDFNHYILKSQSIMNWLNNTCDDKFERQKIINRHKRTSEVYKSLANFEETENDILVNINHFMVLSRK